VILSMHFFLTAAATGLLPSSPFLSLPLRNDRVPPPPFSFFLYKLEHPRNSTLSFFPLPPILNLIINPKDESASRKNLSFYLLSSTSPSPPRLCLFHTPPWAVLSCFFSLAFQAGIKEVSTLGAFLVSPSPFVFLHRCRTRTALSPPLSSLTFAVRVSSCSPRAPLSFWVAPDANMCFFSSPSFSFSLAPKRAT